MHKYLHLALLISLKLFSEEIAQVPPAGLLTSIDNEPSAIVDGCINVISGEFFDYEVDLTIPGPEPLRVERVLSHNNTHPQIQQPQLRWNFNHDTQLSTFDFRKGHYRFDFKDHFGSYLEFKADDTGDRKCWSQLKGEILKRGVINTGRGNISAQTNIRNHQLHINFETRDCHLDTGDGTCLYFKGLNYLHEETYPNRLKIEYQRDKKNQVMGRTLLNTAGNILSSYTIHRSEKSYFEYTACDGRKLKYQFSKAASALSKFYYLTRVDRTDAPAITYEYIPEKLHRYHLPSRNDDSNEALYFFENCRLLRKSYPEERFIKLNYYQLKGDGAGVWGDKKKAEIEIPFQGRLKEILAPLGVDATPVPKWRFEYQLPKGSYQEGTTLVFDALNHKTEYQFNERQRLTSIIKYDGSGKPYTIETLTWGAEDTTHEIELLSRSFGLYGKKEKTFVKTYAYDARGNIIKESLTGNLTGQGIGTRVRSYTYSQDKFNLLLSSTEGKVTKKFTYLPGTNLLASCLHETQKGIFLRHFYEYDENGMVTRHVIDDGSRIQQKDLKGVTERKIEIFERSKMYPIGLPLVMTEAFLDQQGHESISLRKINGYDAFGRLIKQETYDSCNQFCYQEEWSYDAHGNTLTHTNPLTHLITCSFDANDNMVTEQNHHLLKKFSYDHMNRLIRLDELHPDGTLSKHFRYDLCGNPINTIDIFGNETRTEYDAFNRPLNVFTNNSTISYSYDELSHPTKIVDANGHATHFSYTLYGKPYHIIYPDGSEERFEYDAEGQLIKEIHKNGSFTTYQRDAQDRILLTQQFSPTGEFQCQTEAGYSSFHMLWEKDAAGTITRYTYDAQGRKTSVSKEESLVTFEYDALGRVAKTLTEDSAKTFFYDAMGQVTEERSENASGTILTWVRFTYDEAGHKTCIEQDGAITQILYDTHGIPFKTIDPEGHVTSSKLVLNYYSPSGEHLFCLETIDPLGQMTVAIQDAQGRLIEKFKKDMYGKEIQKTNYYYNSTGGCTQTQHTVYSPNSKSRKITHNLEYDALNRPVALIQAAGTPDEKRTYTQYNVAGQKEKIIKPDGVILHFSYDSLNRLIEHFSSDKSFHYRYTYDKNSNPVQVDDLIYHRSTYRTYNSLGRITTEKLANNLTLEMSYTALGNLKTLILPDQSAIHYTYDGPLLKSVQRSTAKGDIRYYHTYDKYNTSGQSLNASLIYNLGQIGLQYTRKGQIQKIASPYYNEELFYDPVGNISQCNKGLQTENYSYDALYQLNQENEHTYSYDSLYNRLQKDGSIYTINCLQQILSDGEVSYIYDPNGNMLKAGDKQFTYDALDRLTSITSGSLLTQFSYDELHRCITRQSFENGCEYLLYIGQNDIGTTDSQLQIKNLRILGKGLAAEIGAAIAIEIEGAVYAPLHDHNGNVTTLINSLGEVVESYRYSAFGETELGNKSINPWRFASKRHEGDYVLFGRRFYDPALGRWLSPDPLGYDVGPNLYAYVNNSPLIHFDAYGLYEQTSFWDRARDFLRDSWNSLRETISRGYDKACDTLSRAGTAIKEFSHHAVPIPLVKDVGGLTGHFLEKGTFKGYISSLQHEHSQIVRMDTKPHLRHDIHICYINGINTSLADAIRHTEMISQLFGGIRVDLLYNGSSGTVGDIGEVAMQKCGIPTHSVNVTIKGLREMIHGVGSSGLVIAMAHSQGGQILHEALQQLPTERIAAVTFGSARIIEDTGTRMSVNYISSRDPIPAISDPLHYARAKSGGVPEVKFIPSIESKRFDHFFGDATYQHALNEFHELFYKKLW